MGYRQECKRGLVVGEEVTIAHGVMEYTGKILLHDNKNNNDYCVVLEISHGDDGEKLEAKKRVVIPLSSNSPVITYVPSADMI